MKNRALVPIALAALVVLGLALAHRVIAGGPFAPAHQSSGPPVKLDGTAAFVSGVNGPTVTNADAFTFEPSSFPPNRLTQTDVDDIPQGWDDPTTAPTASACPAWMGVR